MRAMKDRGQITLVTGGARSGKSALAEHLAMRHDLPLIYIATAQAQDGEMADRIGQHQQARGTDWRLIEAPHDLARALRDSDGQGVRLVDCLTLWLSNALAPDAAPADIAALVLTLRQQSCPVILVTNELGQGIVPGNEMARRFRDDHGRMNQAIAAAADHVWMAVSGLPLRLKPTQGDPDDTI